MIPLGPVSTALEADLRGFIRRHGVAYWLDPEGVYTGFVDQLIAARGEGALPYAVHGFRGSHLALMLELEEAGGGVDRTPLLVHVPGLTEEAVKRSPLLELVEAGRRYRKKLDTLIGEAAGGRVAPDAIASFRAKRGQTLAEADTWLAGLLQGRAPNALASTLEAQSLPSLIDDLLKDGFVASQLVEPQALEGVWQVLERTAGLGAEWREGLNDPSGPRQRQVAFALASWALAVEYVDDLAREPVDPRLAGARSLPRAVTDACRALAVHLRTNHPLYYRHTAEGTEVLLNEEVGAARAEDLGKVDTFRFEEATVLQAALIALDDERFDAVLAWAEPRVAGSSFWVELDPTRRSAWLLLRDAATLGRALVAAKDLDARTHHEAVQRYVRVGAPVDQAHRRLEQSRNELLTSLKDDFDAFLRRLDTLRARWKDWADRWSWAFNLLCRDEGFLPPPDLQQRGLFDEVVRPLTQTPGTTALFLVDALRFEMAVELERSMRDTPATTVHLRPRLAELPTDTVVGMNALAPVAKGGRLRPEIKDMKFLGFSTGEFRVDRPKARQRAMWDRVGGAECPWHSLDDVLGRDISSLKKGISRAKLVIVHSLEIDAAGEGGSGLWVFDQVLQKLRAAWQRLRQAGVRRFVITSDHGFLLLDDHAYKLEAGALTHGRKTDGDRRCVLTTVPSDEEGKVRVALSDLAYDGVEGLHLVFPREAHVFDTGKKSRTFVHGGNSLQERVIPVLTVEHRAAAGADTQRYEVFAEAGADDAGMLRMHAEVRVVDQGSLMFSGADEVELVLEVEDDGEVTVELCDVRGGRRAGAAIHAPVGQPFEVLFRLIGVVEERVRVRLSHPGTGDVIPASPKERFPVSPPPGQATVEPAAARVRSDRSWLQDLPEGGIRQLFAHLEAHGAVTEQEAASMLGTPRALRRFSAKFETHAALAPFEVRIDMIGGVKRYVRVTST